MASKENQEAIFYLSKKLGLSNYPNGTEEDFEKDDEAFGYLITLSKALDDLELYKKAIEENKKLEKALNEACKILEDNAGIIFIENDGSQPKDTLLMQVHLSDFFKNRHSTLSEDFKEYLFKKVRLTNE